MDEIANQLNKKVDFLFCAVSTFGTIRGCHGYITKNNMSTKIIAVDAKGSILLGGLPGKRLIPGLGAGMIPDLCDPSVADDFFLITDLECVVGCRQLVKKESILAGGSTGAIVMAIDKFKSQIKENSNCVFIIHDRGERYLDTIYSDEWVSSNFGDVDYLWQEN
jgi:N-(2-amino-2-carboxyethyl)-L-glutamate synthase